MKCFHFSYPSMWIGGDAIIFAPTEERAKEIFAENRPDVVKTEKEKYIVVKKLSGNQEAFTEINNGDY